MGGRRVGGVVVGAPQAKSGAAGGGVNGRAIRDENRGHPTQACGVIHGRSDKRRPAAPVYQCTPFIRCANATASVVGARSGASSPFPLAACDSGNSLKAVLRILSLTVGATA